MKLESQPEQHQKRIIKITYHRMKSPVFQRNFCSPFQEPETFQLNILKRNEEMIKGYIRIPKPSQWRITLTESFPNP